MRRVAGKHVGCDSSQPVVSYVAYVIRWGRGNRPEGGGAVTLAEIRKRSTMYRSTDGQLFHESLLRSYHIVDKIEELLRAGAPAAVLLEIIEDLRSAASNPEDPRG